MSLKNRQQLENTQRKLRLLEKRLVDLANEPIDNAYIREQTRQSLTRLANQLKEEIAVFESRQSTASV